MKKMKRNFLIQLFAVLMGFSIGGLVAFGLTPQIHKEILSKPVTRESGSKPGGSAGSPVFPSTSPRTTPRSSQHAPGHIIVQFKPGIEAKIAGQIVSQFGATLDGTIFQQGQATIYKVNTGPRETAEDLVKKLNNNVNVKYAELDAVEYLQ